MKGFAVGGTVTHVGAVIQNYERPGRQRLDYPSYTTANLDSAYTWKSGAVTHTLSASIGNRIARVGADRSLTLGWHVAF